jgi:flagellar hook-associated protein 3 FlgL
MRITTEMLHAQNLNNMQRNRRAMDRRQYELSSGKKIRLPEDKPAWAAEAMAARSRIKAIKQYQRNITNAKDANLTLYDTHLQDMSKIINNLNNIAVQGANGTYSGEDRKYMASTVNELLQEMVAIGNSKDPSGRYIFAGHNVHQKPFEIVEAVPQGGDRPMIADVKYHGDDGNIQREIDQSHWLKVNVSGNRLFAMKQHLQVNFPAGYEVSEDSKIKIDGRVVQLNAGDNIEAIIKKINEGNVEVTAFREPEPNNILTLVSRSPHGVFLEDIEGGQVLQDLGLVDPNAKGPYKVAENVQKSGFSLFRSVIKLRNNLLENKVNDIGSADLQALRSAQRHNADLLEQIGSKVARLDHLERRHENTSQAIQEEMAFIEDADMAESITNLMMHEFVHKSALQAGARIIQPTLMDFLR